MAAALEQANGAVAPSARLTSVEAAYWIDAGRQGAPALGDAPRRGAAARRPRPAARRPATTCSCRARSWSGCSARTGSSYRSGTCRSGTGAEALEEPVAAFGRRLEEALAETGDLSPDERAARVELANRQVTLR